MPRLTRGEIEESLLRGKAVVWTDGTKQEVLKLDSPLQRRLYRYVLESKIREVKGLDDAFISGLNAAYSGTDDPATDVANGGHGPSAPGPWKLMRIETSGFGGINVYGGKPFVHDIDGESLIIDGPNGSGKSSLIGALTWAMRGERLREGGQEGDAATTSQVYDDAGKALGNWPPLAAYPPKIGQLISEPMVSVALTFANPAGQEALVERQLKGKLVTHSEDPALAIPPVLVETGLMMPARLAQIRWGVGDRQLTESVQLLTGLDEIAVLGDFVGQLCHRGRDYLNYARTQRRDEHLRQFDDSIAKVQNALKPLGRTCPSFKPSDTRIANGPLADLGKQLKQYADDAVSVIVADLSKSLDVKLAAVQQQIAGAIEGAKSDVSLGLAGIPAWTRAKTIAEAMDNQARTGFTPFSRTVG